MRTALTVRTSMTAAAAGVRQGISPAKTSTDCRLSCPEHMGSDSPSLAGQNVPSTSQRGDIWPSARAIVNHHRQPAETPILRPRTFRMRFAGRRSGPAGAARSSPRASGSVIPAGLRTDDKPSGITCGPTWGSGALRRLTPAQTCLFLPLQRNPRGQAAAIPR